MFFKITYELLVNQAFKNFTHNGKKAYGSIIGGIWFCSRAFKHRNNRGQLPIRWKHWVCQAKVIQFREDRGQFWSRWLMTLATILGVTLIVHKMLTTRGQSGRSRPRSSSVELNAKRSAKRLTLSVGTSGPLKRTGIVDLFLLRMLFAIHKKISAAKTLSWDGLLNTLCVTVLGIFQHLFAVISSKAKLMVGHPWTFSIKLMEIIVSTGDSGSTCSGEPWLRVWYNLVGTGGYNKQTDLINKLCTLLWKFLLYVCEFPEPNIFAARFICAWCVHAALLLTSGTRNNDVTRTYRMTTCTLYIPVLYTYERWLSVSQFHEASSRTTVYGEYQDV